MYKHYEKAQDFVDTWCARLNLPNLYVKFGGRHAERKLGAIYIRKHMIILWEKDIPNRAKFVLVLLHELSHWFLYWRYRDTRYRNEKQVVQISYLLLQEYYPSYWSMFK